MILGVAYASIDSWRRWLLEAILFGCVILLVTSWSIFLCFLSHYLFLEYGSMSVLCLEVLLLLPSEHLLVFRCVVYHNVRSGQSTEGVQQVLVFKLDLLRLFCLRSLQIPWARDVWEPLLHPIGGAPASLFDPIVFVVIALNDKWVMHISPLLSDLQLSLTLGGVEALLPVAHQCCPIYCWESIVLLRRLVTAKSTLKKVACVDAGKQLKFAQHGDPLTPGRAPLSRASSVLFVSFNRFPLALAFHLIEMGFKLLLWLIIHQVVFLAFHIGHRLQRAFRKIDALMVSSLLSPWSVLILVNLLDEDAVHLSLELSKVSWFYLHWKIQQPVLLLVLFEHLFAHRNLRWEISWACFLMRRRNLGAGTLHENLGAGQSWVIHQLCDDFIIDGVVRVGIETGVQWVLQVHILALVFRWLMRANDA